MQRVFIVTSGESFDFCICAVFSAYKDAVDFIEERGEGYNLSVFEVDKYVKSNKNNHK